MQNKIAVVYLARLHEGYASFEAFADTYRRHPAGEPHDLYIICKGFGKPGEYAAIDAIFTGIPHKIIGVDDDIGQDIHSYQEAAKRISNEYICCLNTHSRILADNWLSHLWKAISQPGVGMVGASGSYESLSSSLKALEFLIFALKYPIRFDRKIVDEFRWMIEIFDHHTQQQLRSKKLLVRRYIGDILHNRRRIKELFDRLPSVWSVATSHEAHQRFFRDVPQFPNPHIRSNAFMVLRSDLLANPLPDRTKYSCCLFESGADGLSMTLLRQRKNILVVGANGVAYPLDQWPTSRTFRSGDQSNLLVADNQTRNYDNFSTGVAKAHRLMSWGGYAPEFAADVDLFGVPFSSEVPIEQRADNFNPTPRPQKERLISIAIPTHNRLDLVLEAIGTVRRQDYDNWEIVVFDNASDKPVADAIKALNDHRIRSERSNEFLPVTMSWNRVINMAKGEYVTMLGDDDGIAPGYFDRINYLADRFGNPDLIFSNLYQFMYPGVVPGMRMGYTASLQMADFLAGDHPFILDKATIRRSVDNSLNMRRSFMFNMPAFCSSRQLLERMRVNGNVLQSPFPDYYFANVALELANKVVAEPKPLAFQAVSKVSFGFTMLNQRTDDGFKVLNNDVEDPIYVEAAKHFLSGPRYNSEYIVTMAHVANKLGDGSRRPDFAHYRKVQIWNYLKSQPALLNWRKSTEGAKLWELLTDEERRWAFRSNIVHKLAPRFPALLARRAEAVEREGSDQMHPTPQVIYRVGEHATLGDVYEELEAGPFSPATRPPKNSEIVRQLNVVN